MLVEVVAKEVDDRDATAEVVLAVGRRSRQATPGTASTDVVERQARRNTNATTAETAIDRKRPHALATRAPTVSSATWAEAS